jgi:hypothetical protein
MVLTSVSPRCYTKLSRGKTNYFRIGRQNQGSTCRRSTFKGRLNVTEGAHSKLPGRLAVFGSGLDEAEPAEVIADQAVLGGRNIPPDDFDYSLQAALADEILKDGFLDAPAEHAARHDPAVDFPALAGLVANDSRDHPVVADNILKARLYRENIGIGLQRRDFGFAVAAGRQIELI